jgi:alkylation response protein AidB-like acyl-CoA dehydrogenase
MYLELTDEQGFLIEAATGVLGRVTTLESARAALDGERFTDLWTVAIEAGWPGLLSAEALDGAGLGAYEALLVLEACGARLADARLLGHLPACALLERAGGVEELRRELATGAKRAAFVDARAGEETTAVLDGPGAHVFVVLTPDGVGVVNSSEVSIEHQRAYDATRSLATVRIAQDRISPIAAPPNLGRDLQRALLAAESVGAAGACLEMARSYAVERRAFGRAIGSYQAIKHKLVEMMRRIESGRSLLVGAGRAWRDGDDSEFGLLAGAALVVATDALDYAASENIFVHGGIGATWEHDAQLYYRRAELSRRLAGGVEGAADDVAEALFARITS